MLLDEPFSNLDFGTREFVTGVLERLAEKGMPILMVSHAFDDLPDRKIRIAIMNDGQITYDDACNSCEVEAIVRKTSRMNRCSSS